MKQLRIEGPARQRRHDPRRVGRQMGPARDIVVLNAAAALICAGKASAPREAAEQAAAAINDGASAELLAKLVAKTNS